MSWDALEALIYKDFSDLYDDISDSKISDKFQFIQRGWQRSVEFYRENRVVLNISYGGQNSAHGCYFKATGFSAMEIAERLQQKYSENLLVSRVDIAIDFECTNFLELCNKSLSSREKHDLEISQNGDWITPDSPKGRTLYLHWGKNAKLRIYEKGKEQRNTKSDENAPLDWVRAELEIRAPKGSKNRLFKSIMAGQKPASIWSSYECFVDVLNDTGLMKMDYVAIKRTEKLARSSFDQKQFNLVNQYGKHLREAFDSPAYLNRLIADLYPTPEDIPNHLRFLVYGHIDEVNYLRHGEY